MMEIPVSSFHIHSKSTFGVLLGATLFISCQDANGPEAPKSGALTAQGTVLSPDSLRLPDRGVWRTNNASRSDSGSGPISCAANTEGNMECRQSFSLKGPLGSDQLLQDISVLGVKLGTLIYAQTTSATQLTYVSSSTLPMENRLVRLFNASFKQSHPGQKPTSFDLASFYAERLLTGDTLVAGKPLPQGMPIDSARRALVLAASHRNTTAAALASRSLLGLTTESIRIISTELIKAALLKDSTALFPLPAVRLVDSIRVDGDLVVGGPTVGVTGAFAWSTTKTSVGNPEILIRHAEGAESHVRPWFEELPDLNSGSLNLKGKFVLLAEKGARPGLDTLWITLKGDSGRATGWTTFRVLAGDTTAPSLRITNPPNDTLVPNSTATLVVHAEASDDKGLAHVQIGKRRFTSGPFLDSVDLAVGRNDIVVEAVDLAGNTTSKSVFVIRSKSSTSADTIKPIVALLSPSKDSLVPVGQPTFELSWTATDNIGLRKVTLDETEVFGEAGVYKKTVSLLDGENLHVIKAFDDAGNVGTKSLVIRRPVDTSEPTVKAPADQSVEAKQSSVKLTWKIANSHKANRMALDGKEVPVDSIVVAELPLRPGPNTFTLVVTDAKGKLFSGPVVVTRAIEIVRPSITPLPDRNVGSEDSATVLTWSILNSQAARSGLVNDEPVVVGATIQRQVELKIGTNRFILTLTDSAGQPVADTVFVSRATDAVGPSIEWLSPATSATVAAMTSSFAVKIKVSDPSGIDSVLIAGVRAKKEEAGVFSSIVVLPKPDGKPIAIVVRAWDSRGNQSADSSRTLTRKVDTTGPDLVIASPSSGSLLPYGAKTVSVTAIATDSGSGLASLTLGAKTCTSSPCSGEVAVGPDGKVEVSAKDSLGNVSSKTIALLFDTDKTSPSFVRSAGTNDTVLLATQSSFAASWTVTDNELKSVKIQGVPVIGTAGVYASTVALTGNSQWITIEAADGANTSKDSIQIRRLSLPTVTAGGAFVGSKSVSITAPLGDIEYSIDGEKTWKPYTASLSLIDTTLLVARATLAGVIAKTTPVAYNIAQDVGLTSVTIDGAAATITGASIGAPDLTTIVSTVSIVAKPSDAAATVTIGGFPSPRTIPLDYDSALVTIVVSNRTSSKAYTLRVKLAAAGTFTDSRDSRTYKAVKIGTQWWMSENLKYTAGSTIGGCSNGDPTNCVTYGRNYSWAEVVAGTGVCPAGWHLPNSAEWKTLVNFAGGDTAATTTLLAKTDGGTDKYGFGALLGGLGKDDNGIGGGVGWFGEYWGSALPLDNLPEDKVFAVRFWIPSQGSPVYLSSQFKSSYASVRCVKNF